ncbi:hypothetical protein GCM10011316_07920 [Roseibium aquae]|uniref:Uncharacterized protein n=1 Tax=Roseibium aquae TaxID=1323746 RepID=A0A916WXX1_9HYPH|nr:hypothetical protein GCM10011316_07920 [Roseibium aquae]
MKSALAGIVSKARTDRAGAAGSASSPAGILGTASQVIAAPLHVIAGLHAEGTGRASDHTRFSGAGRARTIRAPVIWQIKSFA